VRCKPAGLSAADTTILVSRTKRRGSIRPLLSLVQGRWWVSLNFDPYCHD
jgi:hypothetical protein